mgnify:CR=1 FL=1
MRDEAARVVNKVVGDKHCKALGEGSVCDETYMSWPARMTRAPTTRPSVPPTRLPPGFLAVSSIETIDALAAEDAQKYPNAMGG